MNDSTNIGADSATSQEPLKAKKKPGRKLDTTGETALGKARKIFADNPGFNAKELKQKFEAELNVKPQVAQTYASLVRKAAKTASV